jgi:hypothetical protein
MVWKRNYGRKAQEHEEHEDLMNPARVGKVLALVSPALAVGVVCFMLFATGYSYVSMEERAGPESHPVEAAAESGWVSAYEYSLENGDYVYFLWSGFIVVICLLAAGAALKGWVGLVWACAVLLGVLSILGAMSIGGMVAPLALVLFVSAILLSLSVPEGS